MTHVDKLTLTTNDPKPGRHRIQIGALDISRLVGGVDVRVRHGEPPTVALKVVGIGSGPLVDGPATVELDDETIDALMTLGWTPPAEPAPEPTQAQQHAERIILSHTKDIDWLTIGEMLGGPRYDDMTADQFDELRKLVDDLIRTATVTVSWAAPEQAERTAETAGTTDGA